ncbi:hypothetical protein EMPS_09191 [Entomortierella parvispora]|uniref:F-box domain-containing protein n=1 Tax=Entomortierella parvispora TaxID=205924 RepID=A0A9P3HIB5_9FUNG|nr:hypothetical protein EMPS_09191 [Entomortierella parvispora]
MAQKALRLPEIVLHIVGFLEFSDLCAVARVSRLWHQAVSPSLPSGDFSWDDNAAWSESWGDYDLDLEDRDTVVAQLSGTRKPRSLTCDFKEFPGMAIYTNQYRDIQKQTWQPILDQLISGQSCPYHLDSNGRNDFFTFPILMKATKLHRVTLWTGDVSQLTQILNLPNLQETLRILSLKSCWWPRTGLPFANKMRFRLTRLDMVMTEMSDPDMKRLLEACPDLRSLKSVDVMARWNVPLIKHLSTYNPQLKTFRFSCKPSTGMAGVVDDAQLTWLVENLNQDLRTLGLYRLNVSLEPWERFLSRFRNLTRLELLGKNHKSNGERVYRLLEHSKVLEHLITENVHIPMAMIEAPIARCACKGLKTLEIGFGSGHWENLGKENKDEVIHDSRTVFTFLARNLVDLERLLIRKNRLAATKEGGLLFKMAHKALSIPEIVLSIAQSLEFSDLVVASRVSRLWYRVIAPDLPTDDFCWDDRPLKATEDLDRVHKQLVNSRNPRSMSCTFRSFSGKTNIVTNEWREQQFHSWRPILDPLISGKVQLYDLSTNHGHLETFLLPTLQNANRLHRLQLWDIPMTDELNEVLRWPELQTLRILSFRGTGGTRRDSYQMRLKAQFPWTCLELESAFITEKTLKQVLECCSNLRVLRVVDSIDRWSESLLRHLSVCNPALRSFRLSCKFTDSRTGGDIKDTQLEVVIDNLDLDVSTLGLYHMNVSTTCWQRFQKKFANLTRLELLGANHESCGPLVYWYLEKSARLEHLVTENVYIPMYLINGTTSKKWVCKGLKTLEIGFGPGPAALLETRDQNHVRAESRVMFAFLARNAPFLERLLIRKRRVAATDIGGIGMLKAMEGLQFLHIDSEEDICETGSLSSILAQLSVMSDVEECFGDQSLLHARVEKTCLQSCPPQWTSE